MIDELIDGHRGGERNSYYQHTDIAYPFSTVYTPVRAQSGGWTISHCGRTNPLSRFSATLLSHYVHFHLIMLANSWRCTLFSGAQWKWVRNDDLFRVFHCSYSLANSWRTEPYTTNGTISCFFFATEYSNIYRIVWWWAGSGWLGPAKIIIARYNAPASNTRPSASR